MLERHDTYTCDICGARTELVSDREIPPGWLWAEKASQGIPGPDVRYFRDFALCPLCAPQLDGVRHDGLDTASYRKAGR